MTIRFVLIAAVALATLGMELFFTKILAFVFWNHVVYLIISIALLGYGASSTFVLLARRRIAAWGEQRFIGANVLLLVAASVGFMLLLSASTYQFEHHRPVASAGSLLLAYLALTLPFFFSGNVVLCLFVSHPARANALYGWDLAGAALGCLLFVVLMPRLGAPGSVLLLLLLACVPSAVFLLRAPQPQRAPVLLVSTVVAGIVLAAGVPFADRWLPFSPDLTKTLGHALNAKRNPGAVREYTKWDVVTRVDVVSSSRTMDLGWGRMPSTVKLITFDGDAISQIPRAAAGFPAEADIRRVREADFHAPFFKRVAGGSHLVIGLGGGPDIADSLAYGAKQITGVDINGSILQAMSGEFAAYSGGTFVHPKVRLVHSEGRVFLRASAERFDLIRMTGVDTFTALSTGAYVLAENYLYTVEALREYFRHLGDDGVLCIHRWFNTRGPRESLRLFATILEALRQEGVENPAAHVAVLFQGPLKDGTRMTSESTGVTFVRRKPYTAAEIRELSGEMARLSPVVGELAQVFYPHVGPSSQPASPIYHAYAEAFAQGFETAFQDRYAFDVSPTTDDRPFFFNYYKVANMFRDWKTTGPIQGYWAYFVFMLILACATVAVAVFIWLPLLVLKREGLRVRNSGWLALYFCCLGLGFIMIEITAMQKFALLLGHPMYSIAAVMGGMLVFAGLGSHLSTRFAARPMPALGACSLVVAAFCVFLASPAATWLIDALLAASLEVRLLATLGIVAVGALPLGFYFPIGLRVVGAVDERFIPWAWGINSGFTVIGSVCAVAAAMKLGFSAILLLSTVIYLVALLAMRKVAAGQDGPPTGT